ncbi:hypothetical protein ACFY7C_19170 [Streptomyces sp. NPDC012769]|uniref:hypothetical protein n=1 Tax=Streptomyces sp. NPDC012769 TaxID=3364848 RepID=UPI003689543B
MTFSQPAAGGDTFEPKNHLGRLLLIFPKAYDPAMKTKASTDPTAAADVDLIIVDEPGPDGQPLFLSGARLFGNLAKSVRNDLGGQVLGRLAQGQPSPGRTAPWILTNFTDQDAAAATPLLAQYQQGLFKPPANPMAAPQGAAAPTPAAAYSAPPYQAAAPSAAPAPQQWQQAPAAPPQQQQWAPTPAPQAAATAPTPPAPATAPAIDPGLVAFLQQRGIAVTPGMTQEQAAAIAAAFQ